MSSSWLLGKCMESSAKEASWKVDKQEVLNALLEIAIVQSAESSNRIEGVVVEPSRLKPILLQNSPAKSRSEEELVGYRKALDLIHASYKEIEITANTIQQLHSICKGGFSGDAGKWKTRNNEIIEILPNGERTVRFVPLAADEVPQAIEQLCLAYREVVQEESVPDLLAIASFVFDFLCIHPFRDGNGRVSRLLTSLLLHKSGFHVVSFISLERIIETRKEEYYQVLKQASQNWHEGEHEILSWWNFFLSVLKQAYDELEDKVDKSVNGQAKSELVKQAVLSQLAQFSLQDIVRALPSVSEQLVKKVLAEMKEEGRVTLQGKGRGARWRVA